ncbi:MAG: ABC transporter ATP-binding protein [Flammeovirgaceae bacterium]
MIVKVKNLSKRFLEKEVLKSISFEINRGEVVGIVGPNGSGKTTLFNVLTRIIKANEGELLFSENVKYDCAITRSEFFGDMSVKNNIKLRCYLSRIDNSSIEGAGNIFDINYFDKLFNSLSAGMKQKVSLTIPFLAHNDLILLDEPTNHLDIDSIIILRNKILKLREEGVSFLIASHGFSELEKVCDRVIFIKNGKILCNERSSDLLLKFNDFENAYQSIISNYKA